MTPKQIYRKRLSIEGKISKLSDQLFDIQELCQHPNVDKKYKASTGNYDPSADSYWIEWLCPDCKKYWHTEQ